MWLDRIQTEGLVEAGVVYGYFPCVSEGDDLVVLDDGRRPSARGSPSPGSGATGTCACRTSSARASPARPTWSASSSSRSAPRSAGPPQELFEQNAYRDYLELHGLSVQLAEALAEYWHTRVRSELGFGGEDPGDIEEFFKLGYRGARFSLGYGACPDLEDRAKIVELLKPERIGVGPVGGVPARPRAVHRRDRRPPPRGEVLQHLTVPDTRGEIIAA